MPARSNSSCETTNSTPNSLVSNSRRLAVLTVLADGRELGGAFVAHLAHDGRPRMQADTDAQRLVEVARHRLVEVVEGQSHAPCRVERLAAGDAGFLFEPEDRHHAVADELVDPAAGRLDGLAGRAK